MERLRIWNDLVWVSILNGREPGTWRVIPQEDIEEFTVQAADLEGAKEEATKVLRRLMK